MSETLKFKTLPKIELHQHLDCALSFDVVKKIKPTITEVEYFDAFVAPPKCHDLADFLKRAAAGFQLMQSEETLRLVVRDLFQQWKNDGVIYGELRYAPLQHIFEGLSAERVVETINDETEKCIHEFGLDARVILCTLRHHSEKQSMDTVNLLKEFAGSIAVGFDIASDEAGYPIDNHIKAFQFAREQQFFITAHAGEAKGATSVWETLEHFRPTRIGHGVRSMEDPDLVKYLRRNDIHLEVCPTSNIQTNIYDQMSDHQIDQIFEADISMSINTDTRTISNVSLSEEYTKLMNHFNWGNAHFLKCNLEAIRHAFIDQDVKNELRKKLLEGFLVVNES